MPLAPTFDFTTDERNTFDSAALNGSNGFAITGIDAFDGSGFSVSGAGDINGDGFADLIIGAPFADSNGNLSAGESYLVFGNDGGFSASTFPGFVINGIDDLDSSGFSVSGAGDINGDGFADLIIGAPGAGFAGESYVVFGAAEGISSRFDLADLDGSNGFSLSGIDNNDNSGVAVSGIGDVNGDGLDDFIIGAPEADPNGSTNAGESYVVFGRDTGVGFSRRFPVASLNGFNGFTIEGTNANARSGAAVSGAGDVNGDGLDDFIIGAPGNAFSDLTGESYVVFGSNTGFGSRLNLSNLNGSNGFVIAGVDAGDRTGAAVSGAGDINGDGLDDLIIGAPKDISSDFPGESYVVFGSDQGFSSRFNLASLNGRNGFAINGINSGDQSGTSVSKAGDVNGDGLDDLIIGGPGDILGNFRGAGESYVVYGSAQGFDSRLNLSALNGRSGFIINGINANDSFGAAVSGAGDVNGDGVDDLIIGARRADPNSNSRAGESYVIFGRQDPSFGFLSFELARQVTRTIAGDTPYTPVEVGGINLGQFFDNGYYLNQNPDVAIAIANGIFSSGFDHFVQFGLAEGRNSTPLFDEQAYLAANLDVAAAVSIDRLGSGLQHFLLFGHQEGRQPSRLFDEADYLAKNPDVAEAVQAGVFGSGFEHYVETGAQEGRPRDLSLFQEDFYIAQNPDVAIAIQLGVFTSGFDHFAQIGAAEGRDPSSLFSNEAYLAANPDVAAAVSIGNLPSGFMHYAAYGAAEGRDLA